MSSGMFDWIKTIALVLLAAGVLPFLYHQIELAQARLATEKVTKKTKNLAFALSIAKGAVGLAEKLTGNGQTQETSAVLAIKQRLQENNMGQLFTDSQLHQIIQQAYVTMKSNGELDALKPSTNSEDKVTTEKVEVSNTATESDELTAPIVEDVALSSEAPVAE